MFYQVASWLDYNYEKIWLITCIIAIIFVVFGTLINNDTVYDVGDTITDFYDEILSE